jgi:hypothetical protein
MSEISSARMDILIEDITNLFVKKNGKFQLADQALGIFSEYANLLYSFLLDDKLDKSKSARDIRSNLRRNRLLFGRDVGLPVGSELREVFAGLKTRNESSYENFKQAFNEAICDLAKTGKKKFSIAYPLNLQLSERIESRIDNRSFKIVDFDEFIVRFQDARQILSDRFENNLKGFLDRRFCFFVIDNIYAGNAEYAESYCNNKLQSILGLLIFCKYYPAKTIAYKGTKYGSYFTKAKISDLSVSRALVFKNELLDTAYYFDENEPPVTFESIEEPQLFDNFRSLLRLYNEISVKSITEKLRNALISYYQASTASDVASSYLKYWICIEFCLLKTQDDKESAITSLLGKLPIWRDKYVEQKARFLSDKRNEYVHELRTEISQHDRLFAKSIAGSLLHYLLLNGRSFTNLDEVRRRYKLLAQTPEALRVTLNEINLALNEIKLVNSPESPYIPHYISQELVDPEQKYWAGIRAKTKGKCSARYSKTEIDDFFATKVSPALGRLSRDLVDENTSTQTGPSSYSEKYVRESDDFFVERSQQLRIIPKDWKMFSYCVLAMTARSIPFPPSHFCLVIMKDDEYEFIDDINALTADDIFKDAKTAYNDVRSKI